MYFFLNNVLCCAYHIFTILPLADDFYLNQVEEHKRFVTEPAIYNGCFIGKQAIAENRELQIRKKICIYGRKYAMCIYYMCWNLVV